MKTRRLITIVTLASLAVVVSIASYGKAPKPPAPAKSAAVADKASYLADVLALLKKKWPRNRTINIVCHGHSVPAGFFKTPVVDTFNAYPHLLHVELKKRFPYAVINVIVTSIGGENAARGARRFERDVLSHNPDIVTIDYSLNDRGLGLEKARASWSAMIKSAQAKGVKVILLTPTADHRAKMDNPSDRLNQHARQVEDLAKAHNVALVDSYAAFKAHIAAGGKLKELMSQVNHPNRKGHDLVVKELMKWFPG